MEKMYAENDIQEFKKEAITSLAEDEKQREKDIKDMSLKAIELDKNLLTLTLKNVEEDYNSWFLSIKKNKTVRKFMELRMKELNPEPKQPIEESMLEGKDKIEPKKE